MTHHGLQLTTCDRGPHLTIFTMTSWAFLTTIEKTRKKHKTPKRLSQKHSKTIEKTRKTKKLHKSLQR